VATQRVRGSFATNATALGRGSSVSGQPKPPGGAPAPSIDEEASDRFCDGNQFEVFRCTAMLAVRERVESGQTNGDQATAR
jgi:hypothetical protein